MKSVVKFFRLSGSFGINIKCGPDSIHCPGVDSLLFKMNKYNNWVNYDYNYSSDIEYLDENIDLYLLNIEKLFNNEIYNYEMSISYLKNKSMKKN